MGLADTLRGRVLKAAEALGVVRTMPYWPGLGFPPAPAAHGLPDNSFIVAPARRLAVFRLIGYRPEPQLRDFQSNYAKERPQGPDEPYVDYLGLSVFSTEEPAIENAVRWPTHIAEVLLPQAEGFSIARTVGDA